MNGIRTSPATLERVTEAAEAIGYVPNAAARSLRSRRTGQIAFAMPDVGNPVYTTMIRDLKHRFVDGLILASLDLTEANAVELRRAAAPVVVIGRPGKETAVDT